MLDVRVRLTNTKTKTRPIQGPMHLSRMRTCRYDWCLNQTISSTLRAAANGEIFLDVKNPKLFKKVRRYYENNGVVFSGDPMDDYEMLMEHVFSDLESVEVA